MLSPSANALGHEEGSPDYIRTVSSPTRTGRRGLANSNSDEEFCRLGLAASRSLKPSSNCSLMVENAISQSQNRILQHCKRRKQWQTDNKCTALCLLRLEAVDDHSISMWRLVCSVHVHTGHGFVLQSPAAILVRFLIRSWAAMCSSSAHCTHSHFSHVSYQ